MLEKASYKSLSAMCCQFNIMITLRLFAPTFINYAKTYIKSHLAFWIFFKVTIGNQPAQAEVPDRYSICPDQKESTRGVPCVQNYTIWKHE